MLSPSVLFLIFGLATSGAVHEVVAAAQAAEAELNYDRAVELWLDVLAEPGLPEATKLDGHVRLGTLYRIIGDEGEARSHFRWVLAKQPDFQLPSDAPRKVQAFFEMVREEMQATQSATLPPAPPAPVVEEAVPAQTSSESPPEPARTWGNPASPALLGVGAASGLAALGCGGLSMLLFSVGDDGQRRALAEDVQIARDELYDERDGAYLFANLAGVGAAAFTLGAVALVGFAFVEAP